MYSATNVSVVTREFHTLESGDKFIRLKDILSGGWVPLYIKIMENVELKHPTEKAPLSVQAVNSIGGLQPLRDDEKVIIVK